MPIHAGDRSVSVRSPSPVFAAREADIVPITPLTTGPISLIRVQIEATPMAPAPMKRTCVRQM